MFYDMAVKSVLTTIWPHTHRHCDLGPCLATAMRVQAPCVAARWSIVGYLQWAQELITQNLFQSHKTKGDRGFHKLPSDYIDTRRASHNLGT